MYAGYQHPGGYYDEQQAFDPYAVPPPEGYQQGYYPQTANAYGYPEQQQQYYAPYGMAAGYGYDASMGFDPSMVPASMAPTLDGVSYTAQPAPAMAMGMQQQQQQYQQQYQPIQPRAQAAPPRPTSSTPSSSSTRPPASSNGAASGSNHTQQSHLAAGAGATISGAKHVTATLDPSNPGAATTSTSPSSTSSPRPQGQQGSLGSSLGGLSSLPPRPNFEPAASQFSVGASSSNINGGTIAHVASLAPPAQHASGNLVRPTPVPRLGSQMMQQQQSEGGISSSSNKANVLGVQLLEKLPPLPPLPALRQDVPAALAWLQKNGHVESDQQPVSSISPAELDEDAKSYITSLHDALQAYQRREEAMQLRIEAMAFRPTESWTALRVERGDEVEAGADSVTGDSNGAASSSLRPPASVLGVRLLRKVTELQRENDELGALLSEKLGLEEQDAEKSGEAAVTANGIPAKGSETEQLLADLQDAHSLLSNLSTALKDAESRASKAEAALQVAVQSRSRGILDRSSSNDAAASSSSLASSPPQQPRQHHHHQQQQQPMTAAAAAGTPPAAPRQSGHRQQNQQHHHHQQQQRGAKPKQRDGSKTAAAAAAAAAR